MSVRLFLFILMSSVVSTAQPGILDHVCSMMLQYRMKTHGTDNVCQSFATPIRQFLHYLGVKNPQHVAIKKFSDNFIKSKTEKSIALTYSNVGIWLHEQEFHLLSEGVRLFIFAHEAAHYVESCWSAPSTLQEIEKLADLKAVEILCALNYAWAVQEYIDHVKHNIERGTHYDELHPPIEEQYTYLTQAYSSLKTTH